MTYLIAFCALALAAALAILIWTLLTWKRYAKLHASILSALKAKETHKIEIRFGSRLSQRTTSNWYDVLHEISFQGINKSYGLHVRSELIFIDEKNQYWHMLAITAHDDSFDSFALTSMDELRARRALFNKPQKYLAAFGENPDRKQLARLMGGADESVASCARSSCTSDKLSI